MRVQLRNIPLGVQGPLTVQTNTCTGNSVLAAKDTFEGEWICCFGRHEEISSRRALSVRSYILSYRSPCPFRLKTSAAHELRQLIPKSASFAQLSIKTYVGLSKTLEAKFETLHIQSMTHCD